MFMIGRDALSPTVAPVVSGAVARLYTGIDSCDQGGAGGSGEDGADVPDEYFEDAQGGNAFLIV